MDCIPVKRLRGLCALISKLGDHWCVETDSFTLDYSTAIENYISQENLKTFSCLQ